MKKITFITLAILALCVSAFKVENPMGPGEVVKMAFTAKAELDESITKTTLVANDAGKKVWVNWTSSDALSIFDGSANNRFDIDWDDESSVEARFVGEAASGASAYYALCPYQEGATYSANKITATIPTTQVISSRNYDPSANLQIGTAADGKIPFKNVCALIKLIVPADAKNVTSMTVKVGGVSGDSSKGFAGATTFNASTGAVVTRGTGKSVTLTGTLNAGDTCYVAIAPGTYTNFAVTFTSSEGTFTRTKLDSFTAARNHIYAVTVERNKEGELPGYFSVSDTKWAIFSKGNLQYRASDGDWRFAGHQYSVIGESNNENTASGYNKYVDLFGYGASGYNSKHPYMSSTDDTDYYSGNINGTQYDWGVRNAISNGGGIKGLWFTMTSDEWVYLLTQRANASSLRTKGKVNGINGMIVLPDDWSGTALTTVANSANFTGNSISLDDWNTYWEPNGAVFLPCGGYRTTGRSVKFVSTAGLYWTSTTNTSTMSYCFSASHYSTDDTDFNECRGNRSTHKFYGFSVRLVKYINKEI